MKLKELAEAKAHIKAQLEKHWGEDVSCSQGAVIIVMAKLAVAESELRKLKAENAKRIINCLWRRPGEPCVCHYKGRPIGICRRATCPLLKKAVKK